MFKAFFIIFSFFFSFQINAQEEKRDVSYGLETGLFVSHTGFNTHISAQLTRNNNQIYLGTKFSLSDAYTLSNLPWGFNLGYRRIMPLTNPKWKTFIGIDYNLTFSKVNRQVDKKNKTHEAYLNYGLQFFITDKLSISNSIGYGIYAEYFYDFREDETNSFFGNNSLIQFRFSYILR